MKIAFIGLASCYTPQMNYQENALCQYALNDGHTILYLSNPEMYVNGKLMDTQPIDIMLNPKFRLVRLNYKSCISKILTKKIRKFDNVYELLSEFQPDIIFCHNFQYLSVLDVLKYKKEHMNVKFFVDTHVAAFNSGRNWMSLHMLHGVFYKYLMKECIPYMDKFFFIGKGEMEFAKNVYKIPIAKMEYYPLGGVVFADEVYKKKRLSKRNELNLDDNELLLIHTGKLDRLKRTKELLNAFIAVQNLKAKLVIIGRLGDDVKNEIETLIGQDRRIIYLGWKNSDDLLEYLCAGDLYCQPGSPSATMQNAICTHCAILSYPQDDYVTNINYNCFIWCKDEKDIENAFIQIADNEIDIEQLKKNADLCAEQLLDYKVLAGRIYQ